MSTKKNTNIFAEPVEEDEVVIAQPAPNQPDLKRARIKGTWIMYWGNKKYDFVNGTTYHIPLDLFEYLKKNGNIYDTL